MSVPLGESQSTSPFGVERLKEPGFQRSVVELFHSLYYQNRDRTWLNTYWQGVRVTKCPLDLWIYQEILFEVRPDVIIECGTSYGGSALYLAGLCDLLGTGRIYSVDINQRRELPTHPRIEFLRGSSTSPEIVESLRSRIRPDEKVLVILDSDHSRKHVLAELESYAPLVTPGSYLIVEDTNINGHPVFPGFGPGPMEALDEFLLRNGDFETDLTREKFLVTFNPRGYLRRLRKSNE
jgi:cephalosporin hydroxylase